MMLFEAVQFYSLAIIDENAFLLSNSKHGLNVQPSASIIPGYLLVQHLVKMQVCVLEERYGFYDFIASHCFLCRELIFFILSQPHTFPIKQCLQNNDLRVHFVKSTQQGSNIISCWCIIVGQSYSIKTKKLKKKFNAGNNYFSEERGQGWRSENSMTMISCLGGSCATLNFSLSLVNKRVQM